MNGKSGRLQLLRGAMLTPSGDKIPMKVRMRSVTGFPAYTHIGEIEVPSDWLVEFEEAIHRFVFRSEDGECFTQYQVLEEASGAQTPSERRGRIILMRDLREENAPRPSDLRPNKTSHLQLVGA